MYGCLMFIVSLHCSQNLTLPNVPTRCLLPGKARWLRTCSKLVRAKFHYTSWFGASSELAPNMFEASSEPASVMEFGREPASSC